MGSRLPAELQQQVRQDLNRRKQALLHEVSAELSRSDESQYIDLAGRVHDLGDESVADLLKDVEIAIVGNHVRELRHIEEALARLDSGRYGVCDACGEAIHQQRLILQPTAIRCVSCQDRYERELANVHSRSL